jgi:hypothetical protein
VTRIADLEVILGDTGPFCRLAEAGEPHLDIAADYLKPRLQIVMDVQRELRRRAAMPVHARLHRLAQLGVPERDPITITDKYMLERIEEIVEGRRRRKPGHADADRGEVATALVAGAMRVPILMDDGWGKRFAISQGVRVFTTQDLAVELAATQTLTSRFAYGNFRIVYADATRPDFDHRVEEFRVNHP